MVSRTVLADTSPSVIPIDDQTHAMLRYAKTPEAQELLERARREIAEGKGIEPTPEYFAGLNDRISRLERNNEPAEA